MPDPAPMIAILGEPRLDDFGPLVRFARQRVGDKTLCLAANLAELRDLAESGGMPAMIVVLQAWPDEYSIADVNDLIARFPTARLICCYGPWCDSDGRARSIWPLAVRVSAASFNERFEHELALAATRESQVHAASTARWTPMAIASRALPLTASRTEIFEFDFGERPVHAAANVAVAVISPDRRWRGMVLAAHDKQGAQVVDDVMTACADMVFIDVDPWNLSRAEQLATIRQAQPEATLIACTGFLRHDLESALHNAGADRVRFKLESVVSLTDLSGSQACVPNTWRT